MEFYFQTASKPTSRSASKVSITTKKAGCTTDVFVITTKRTLDEIERTGDLTTRDLLRKGWGDINKKAV